MSQEFSSAFSITPTANTNFQYSKPLHGIYIGSAGNVNVRVQDKNGAINAVTFTSVPAGKTLKLKIYAVLSANTTASNIVGLY